MQHYSTGISLVNFTTKKFIILVLMTTIITLFLFLQMQQNISYGSVGEVLYQLAVKYDSISDDMLISVGIIYALLLLASLILNWCICYLFGTKTKLRSPANLITSMLLWNSSMITLTVMPMTFIEICISSLRYNKKYIAIRCYFLLLYIWSSFVSTLIIAVNRMISIQANVAYQNHKRLWKQYIALVIALLISVAMPLFFASRILNDNFIGALIFSITMISVMTISLVVCYLIIILVVKKSKKRLGKLGNNTLSRFSDGTLKKLKRTVHLVLGSFTVFTLPSLTHTIILTLGHYNKDWMINDSNFLNIYHVVSNIIIMLSAIVNPLVYFYTQDDIKKELNTLISFKHKNDQHYHSSKEKTLNDGKL